MAMCVQYQESRDLILHVAFPKGVWAALGRLIVVTLLLSLSADSSAAKATQQVAGPDLVVVEAENFHDNVPQGGHEWQLATDLTGFSGGGFMRAIPDSGANIESGYDTGSPRLDIEVDFQKTGTHYVWIRYLKTGGQDDSCHVGIDGEKGSDAEDMSATGSDNMWNWSNERRGDLGRAKLEIGSAGVHTVNVWMREDGFRLDKIVLTTDESYKPTDEIPMEHPGTDVLPSQVEPNEPEPIYVEPNEPVPGDVRSTTQPVPDRVLRRTAFEIGPEVYSFKYEEPGLMEEEGTFYGLRLGYTSREWVPSSPGELSSGGGAMGRLEARFAYGQVDYDGATQGGSPLAIGGIDDFAFEGRLSFGADLLHGNVLNTFYSGIGYRYLRDDLSVHPGGYLRESNYIYLPLGYQFDADLEAGWSWAASVEYDVFLWGKQRSHLSDFHPAMPDVDNEQDSGFGYRVSCRLQHKGSDGIFIIEPFFRLWDIDDSEISLGFFEPANETTEIGISVVWMY